MPQSGGGGPSGQKKKKKGRAPAHQNKYAFRHNPKSKKTDKILASPNVGVCSRCHEKIEWRKKYRKYKPRTQLGKCNLCQRRTVKAAYHTICCDCAVGDKANRAVAEHKKTAAKRGKTAVGEEGETINSKEKDGAEIEPESQLSSKDDNANAATNSSSKPNMDAETYDAGGNDASINNNDEAPPSQESKKQRNRRVCEICVKEYVLGAAAEEDADDDMDLQFEGRLKLRERRALERKMERMQQEKKTKKKQSSAENDDADENADNEDDDDESSNNSDVDSHVAGGDLGENDEEDPFLKAVGGADKLLTGDAYQKALLEKGA